MARAHSAMLVIALALLGASFAAHAADPCTQWDLSGHWKIPHTNGEVVELDLEQSESVLGGKATYCEDCDRDPGLGESFTSTPITRELTGSINGDSLKFTIPWDEGYSVGDYTGVIDANGRISGHTYDLIHPENTADWHGNRLAVCVSRRLPVGEQRPQHVRPPIAAQTPPPRPVRCLGKALWTATAKNDVDIYDGPGGEFTVVGILAAATSAPIIGQKDDWFQLKTASAPAGSGWVAGDHLTTIVKRPACP